MSKTMAIAFTMVLAALPSAARAATPDQSALMFAARAADGGLPSFVKATVGALPAGWTPPVPLPRSVPILGSLQRTSRGSTEVLYEPSDAGNAYAAYVSALQETGYVVIKARPGPFAKFGSASTVFQLYCRGLQGIDVSAQADGDDLRVDVLSARAGPLNGCTRRQSNSFAAIPVPRLVAPPATIVSVEGSSATSDGYTLAGAMTDTSTGALVSGNVTAPQLLQLYESQLTNAGWHVTASSHSADAGFASLTYAGGAGTWNAVLALYPAGKRAIHVRLLASGHG